MKEMLLHRKGSVCSLSAETAIIEEEEGITARSHARCPSLISGALPLGSLRNLLYFFLLSRQEGRGSYFPSPAGEVFISICLDWFFAVGALGKVTVRTPALKVACISDSTTVKGI